MKMEHICFFKCKQVSTLWSKLLLDHEHRSLALLPSGRDVFEEIMKMKENTQRKGGDIAVYIWWLERCAVREGEEPKKFGASSTDDQYLC